MATSTPITRRSSKNWLKEHTASFLRKSREPKTIAEALHEMDDTVKKITNVISEENGDEPEIVIMEPQPSRKRKASPVRQETPKKSRLVEVIVLDEKEADVDIIIFKNMEDKEKEDQEVQQAIREIEEECPPTPPPRTTSRRLAIEEESPKTAESSTTTTTDAPAASTPTSRRQKVPDIRRFLINKKPVDDTTVTMKDLILSPSVITLSPRRSSCSFLETRMALYIDPTLKHICLPKIQKPFQFVETSDIFPKIRCAAVIYILTKPLRKKDLPDETPTVQVTVNEEDNKWLESFPSDMEICDLRNALEAFVRELCWVYRT